MYKNKINHIYNKLYNDFIWKECKQIILEITDM